MDVRCPKCSTEYSVSNIPPEGFSIRCTVCGFKFRIAQQVTVIPESNTQQMPALDSGQIQQGKWVLRRADGRVDYFKELTTLQRWIVEGRVSENDQISKGGKTWKRLGDMVELTSFFQVVRNLPSNPRSSGPGSPTQPPLSPLERGLASETIAPRGNLPRPPQPPQGPGPGETKQVPRVPGGHVPDWSNQGGMRQQPSHTPPYGSIEDQKPTLVMNDAPFALDEFDEDYRVSRGGGGLKWALLGLFGTLVVVVVVGVVFFRPTLAGWFPQIFGSQSSQTKTDTPTPTPTTPKRTVVVQGGDVVQPVDVVTPAPGPIKGIVAKADTISAPDATRVALVVDALTPAPTANADASTPSSDVTQPGPLAKVDKPTPNPKAPTGDPKAPTGDPKAPTGDSKAPTGDSKAPTGDPELRPIGPKKKIDKRVRDRDRKKKQLDPRKKKGDRRDKRRRRDDSDSERTPRGYQGMIDKGKKYLDRGEANTALNFFFKAHMANPSSTKPLLLLATTYNRLGSPASAIVYYRKVLALNGNNLAALYGIGMAHLRTGNKASAAKFFQKYLSISPNGGKASQIKAKLQAMGL